MSRVQTRRNVKVPGATMAALDAWAERMNTSVSSLVEWLLDDEAPRPIGWDTFHTWNAKRIYRSRTVSR